MSANLMKYDEARRALAAAHRVDEAKDIRDKAVAVEAYARQAKDQELERWVKEIRLRAERRTGELLREMEKQQGNRGAAGPGRGNKTASSRSDAVSAGPTLEDLKITRNESSLWQKLAAIPEREFEKRVKAADLDAAAMTARKILHPPSANGHHREPFIEVPWDMAFTRMTLLAAVRKEQERMPKQRWKELATFLRALSDQVEAGGAA